MEDGPATLQNHFILWQIEYKLAVIAGISFWCLLDIVPIKNEKSEVVLFLASHKDVTSTKNRFAGVNSLPVPGMDGDSSDDEDLDTDLNDCHSEANGGGHALNSLDPEAPMNYNYGRRRSRAVLYQLSGHYKTGDKTHKKIHSKLNASVSCKAPTLRKNSVHDA